VLIKDDSVPLLRPAWDSVAGEWGLQVTFDAHFLELMNLFINQTSLVESLRRAITHQGLLEVLGDIDSPVLQITSAILGACNLLFPTHHRMHMRLPDLPDLDADVERNAPTQTVRPPPIRWIYANPRCRTPPTIVPACSYPWKTPWTGRLYLAPLDAVIAEDTLRYYSVSLVVNCLGMYSQSGMTPEWRVSQKRRRPNIQYIDFPIGYGINRMPWENVFKQIASHLHDGKVVFVHCKNGRDRSGFALFAFLRLYYRLPHDLALSALSGRIRAQDFPFARFAKEIAWINSVVP